MTIKEFAGYIAERINILYPNYIIDVRTVAKNNGIVLTGLSITDEDECRIRPTIYLDKMFREYTEEGRTEESIIEEIAETYRQNKAPEFEEVDKIFDFNWVKDRIYPRLVRKTGNIEIAGERYYQTIEPENADLMTFFYILYKSDEEGQATIQVTDEMINRWGVTPEDMVDFAYENLDRTERKIEPIGNVILSLLGELGKESPIGTIPTAQKVYVITTKNRTFGATLLLDEKVRKEIAETLGGEAIILPSSVHEIIALKDPGEEEYEDLIEMVASVNNEFVIPEEILSYQIYKVNTNGDLMVLKR